MDNREMINLYYSRSDIDQLEFIFTQAARWTREGGKALVIVPDQYTLETERKAFSVLQSDGLMDLQIMSFSRMAAKLTEGGGGRYIDDLGSSVPTDSLLISFCYLFALQYQSRLYLSCTLYGNDTCKGRDHHRNHQSDKCKQWPE